MRVGYKIEPVHKEEFTSIGRSIYDKFGHLVLEISYAPNGEHGKWASKVAQLMCEEKKDVGTETMEIASPIPISTVVIHSNLSRWDRIRAAASAFLSGDSDTCI